jgi:YVTN family beta-propeller protein
LRDSRLRRGALSAVLLCAALALSGTSPAAGGTGNGEGKGPTPETRNVLFVGNNWDGTVDVVLPRGDFRKIAKINVIPDLDERMAEIYTDPVRLGYFLGIRQLVGEGHDQYADDMYTTNDGRLLIISRPSFRDVVAIELESGELVWRFVVDGQRSDHMAISPDGKHVAVSASTGNVVHILDVNTGEEVGQFPSGDSPHENIYSADGKRIYHASIGLVYTPADDPSMDSSKGERYFQIVDAETNEIIKRIDMGDKLEEAGYPEMSSSVRPMTITHDERFVYFQVSFFHGFVEYDLRKDKVKRLAELPISEEAAGLTREQYLLDSAHHGIALNKKDTRLCVAGTMSDYAAIVSRKTFRYKLIRGGEKPYWSTESNNGRYCFVSWSGSDRISVISYKTKKEIARVPVGYHPQRMRIGSVPVSWVRSQG